MAREAESGLVVSFPSALLKAFLTRSELRPTFSMTLVCVTATHLRPD